MQFLGAVYDKDPQAVLIWDGTGLIYQNQSALDAGLAKATQIIKQQNNQPNWERCYERVRSSGSAEVNIVEEGGTAWKVSCHCIEWEDTCYLVSTWVRTVSTVFSNLAEATPEVVIVFDNEWRVTYANHRVEAYTGHTPAEFIGKSFHEMNFFPENLMLLWEHGMQQVYARGKSELLHFWLASRTYFEWHITPLLSPEGKVTQVVVFARDLTPLKVAQHELMESKAMLIDAMEVANLAVWEFDFQTNTSIPSEAYCKMTGIDRDKLPIPMTGRYFMENIVHPEDRQRLIDSYERARRNQLKGGREMVEYRMINTAKGTITILGSVKVRVDEKGVPVTAYGTIQNITALKDTEAALDEYRLHLEEMVRTSTRELEESEARLSEALKTANLGTWEYDCIMDNYMLGDAVKEGIKSYYPSLESLPERLRLQDFLNFIYPPDRVAFVRLHERAKMITDEDWVDHHEYRAIDEQGNTRYIYISIKIAMDQAGRQVMHYGTLQDITRLRYMEHERERLTDIIEATPDIVGIADVEGKLIYLNEAGRSLYGNINRKDLNSLPASMLYPNEVTREALNVVLEKGTWSGENILIKPNGDEMVVSQVILAHRGRNGDLECYSTILRDITEQKRVERDLKYKNNELDTFVYSTGHDLKGPIASLMGLYNIVKLEIQDEASLSYFEMYHKQILRLNEIILNLLQLTRIKEQEATPEEVDFIKLAQDCVNSFRHLEHFDAITFRLENLITQQVFTDSRLMRTILQNLIENAIKYSRDNVKSWVHVRVENGRKAGTVSIIVSDNGMGIRKEYQEKIFNMFFRGTESSQGSGLGLYILRNAVEKLSGTIHLTSEPEKGTVFRVSIPSMAPPENKTSQEESMAS